MAKKKRKQSRTASSYSGPFLEIRRIGHCVNDKARTYIEYAGKYTVASNPARPLTCFLVPLIRDLCAVVGYENEAQFKEDIDTVKYALDRLKYVPYQHPVSGEATCQKTPS